LFIVDRMEAFMRFGCKAAIVVTYVLVSTLSGVWPLAGAERTVWEIGKFDQSSLEFTRQIDFSNPQDNPVFTVGKSDPNKDWPAEQPGSANKDAGERAHPYTIVFNLSEPPRGAWWLDVSVILSHSRVPSLQVELNGKSGRFYFRRKVSYYPGDFGVDSPIYGGDRARAQIPNRLFKAGENKLVLTAMDDRSEGEGDSWLSYDALRLTQDEAGKPAASWQADVDPSFFYVRHDDGLAELVTVTVTLDEPVRSGEMELSVAGQKLRSAIATAADFGQWRKELAIPELSGPTDADISIRVNGRTRATHLRLVPQRKWTAYVAPHAHLDIGYTDYQAKVAEIHNRNIDKLLDEIDAHPEMRFSLDGSWIVRQYLASRNAQARARLLSLMRAGKIAVPAQLANLMTGYPTMEELIRSTAYSAQLHREEKIPFDYVNITDVPSYTWSYPSALHALGIRYFSAASNNDRGPILLYGHWNEKSPFWWQGPDGSKVLMSYARQYFQLSFVCGVPAQEVACRQSLPTFFQQYQSPSYKPDAVLMYGSQVENTDLIPGEPEFVRKWNSNYAYPRMVLATFPDYMRYVDQHFGPDLPTVVGDGGPYWEDGYGTDAHYLAIDRSSQQRAPSAEKLATIATFLHPNVSGPAAQIRSMWDDLVLYAEHTFTYWGGYSRPESEETVRQFATKDQFAVDGRERVNAILDQALSQLADQIHVPAPGGLVFNSLNWTRSELVETDLDAGYDILESPGGSPVPVEVLAHHEDYDHVRFLARDVPSLGYRFYPAAPRKDPRSPRPGDETLPPSNVCENDYYRIEVDPAVGALKSVYDKQIVRELVDAASPYRFNQYLYVSGGDGETQLIYLRKSLPLANLTVSTASGGRVARVHKTSYGQVLTYVTSGSQAPSIESEIILFDHEKKLEFINRLHKDPVDKKEAVYFAFPVAAAPPEFSYEIQNGWVDPLHNLLKGANSAWFTVQHWVKVSSPGLSVGLVPIDSPLVTLGDINRGTWPEGFEAKSGTIFSYALNNYWHTNFRRVQRGEFVFRYVLTSGRDLEPEDLARLGRSAMTPLELGQLLPNDKFGNPERPLTEAPTSFLSLDATNVAVEDWKTAEDGTGTVVRLLETGGRAVTARLTLPLFTIDRAWLANALEENQEGLNVDAHSVEVNLKPHELLTLRIVAQKLR
jgi:hypothetical protein